MFRIPVIQVRQPAGVAYHGVMALQELARAYLPHELEWFQTVVATNEAHALNPGGVKRLVERLTGQNPPFLNTVTMLLACPDLDPEGEIQQAVIFDPSPEQADPHRPSGLLSLRSSAFRVVLDGRHEVAAFRQAIQVKPALAAWEVSVMLLPFPGAAVVRRLFGDLHQVAHIVRGGKGRAEGEEEGEE